MPPAHRALASGPLPSLKHSSSAPNPGVQWTRVAPLRSPLTPDVRLARLTSMSPPPLPPEHQRTLLAFATGALEASAFEAWLYGVVGLDVHLTPDEFLALFSPDLRSAPGVAAAREATTKILDSRLPHDTALHQASSLVAAVLDGSIPLLYGLQQLSRLSHESPGLIPGDIANLYSDFEGVPSESSYHLYSPAYVARQLALLEGARPTIISALEAFLRQLQREHSSEAPAAHSAS